MKNNIEYFRHYVDSLENPKLKMLRVKFSWAGEGRYWALLSMIGRQENCWLDLSKPFQRGAIAADLGMGSAEFAEFIDFLANPEECSLIIRENGMITTPELQETLQTVSREREQARLRKNKNSGGKKESSGELPEIHPKDEKQEESSENPLKVKGRKEKIQDKNLNKHVIATKSLNELIEPYRGKFAPRLIEDFLLHWDETDTKGVPRWKKQKTWETLKRLTRWQRNQENWDYERAQRQKFKSVPDNDPPAARREYSDDKGTGFQPLSSILSGRTPNL